VAIPKDWGLPPLKKKKEITKRKRKNNMKTALPPYIDEKRPMVLRTADQRLLAEILYTLEKLVMLLSPAKPAKSGSKEKK